MRLRLADRKHRQVGDVGGSDVGEQVAVGHRLEHAVWASHVQASGQAGADEVAVDEQGPAAAGGSSYWRSYFSFSLRKRSSCCLRSIIFDQSSLKVLLSAVSFSSCFW